MTATGLSFWMFCVTDWLGIWRWTRFPPVAFGGWPAGRLWFCYVVDGGGGGGGGGYRTKRPTDGQIRRLRRGPADFDRWRPIPKNATAAPPMQRRITPPKFQSDSAGPDIGRRRIHYLSCVCVPLSLFLGCSRRSDMILFCSGFFF